MPKFIGLEQNEGSEAGSIIYARVLGVGVDDLITLYSNDDDTEICKSAEVVSYGRLKCVTKAKVIVSAVGLYVKVPSSGASYSCDNNVAASNCLYKTFDSTTTMAVTSITVNNPSELAFSGQYFPSVGCEVYFEGLKADSCTVNDSSSATATFNNGVPTTQVTAAVPELLFVTPSTNVPPVQQDYANMEAVVSNPI